MDIPRRRARESWVISEEGRTAGYLVRPEDLAKKGRIDENTHMRLREQYESRLKEPKERGRKKH